MAKSKVAIFMAERTDEEIFLACTEIMEFEEKGWLKEDGLLRKWYNDFFPSSSPLFVIQSVVEHEAAQRWMKKIKEH